MVRIRNLALLALIALGGANAQAAELRKTRLEKTDIDLIEIAGDIAPGDERKFIDLVLASPSAMVLFQSNGGDLLAGIEIGKAIRLKGFATVVVDEGHCASACALAWLGGRIRFMSESARVGFHAAYTSKSGQSSVSSAGNALVGAYLNQIGLPMSAVVYITGTAPDDMRWLTFSDAQAYGIDVKRFDLPSSADSQDSHAGSALAASERAIRKETLDLVQSANSSSADALAYLQTKYAESVTYFGKASTRAAILSDKRSFFARWPNRAYGLRAGSLSVSCQTAQLCKASGVVNWQAQNKDTTSTGEATFEFTWSRNESGQWKVSAETGKVLKRNVAKSAPVSRLPTYALDATESRVVALANLYPSSDCHLMSLRGRVIKTEHAPAKGLTGFLLQTFDGAASFINVDAPIDELDMVGRGYVLIGLNVLLPEGRTAEISVKACGAAGRMLFVDAVR